MKSLFIQVVVSAILLGFQQSPLPPGPPQTIEAPVVVTPKPVDETKTTDDKKEIPFAIVGDIRGKVIDTPTIELSMGQTLVLTLVGDVLKPNADGKLPDVFWSYNLPIPDLKIRDGGHYASISSDEPGKTFLVTASINNPDPLKAPLVASRWIVISGHGPQPPPTKPTDPVIPPPVTPTTKVTSVTYVYEKDDGPVPSAVEVALNKLNIDRNILATLYEDDATNGEDEIPAQYKTPRAVAVEKGLPCLVVMGEGDKVIGFKKTPLTEQDVYGVVP